MPETYFHSNRRGVCPRPGRADHPRSGARGGQVHPDALLAGRHFVGGRLPPLHRGGLRRGPPAARLHHSGAGRHERHHQLRETHAVPADRRRVPFQRTQSPCAVCVSNNHCELQAMAQRLGVTSVRYPYAYPKLAGGRVASALRAGPQPLHPVHALRPRMRGSRRRACLGREFARHPQHDRLRHEPPWAQASSCTNCGKCVQVCPTGALAEKGFAVDEMVKQDRNVTRLTARRGGHL